MKHRNPSLLVLLALALAIPAAAAAEPLAFKIDPSHTHVGFNVRHFFTKVPGRFNQIDGTILLDEKDLAKSSVEVTIATASIDTENERRDNHLRSPDFFAADSFPSITFKSTRVVPGPDQSLMVHGDLTMRGVTRAVTLETTFLGAMEIGGQRGPRRVAGFEAKTTINRKDYGILWNRTLDQGGVMLGDDVNVVLQIEANHPDPAMARPAAATPPAEKK